MDLEATWCAGILESCRRRVGILKAGGLEKGAMGGVIADAVGGWDWKRKETTEGTHDPTISSPSRSSTPTPTPTSRFQRTVQRHDPAR